MRRRPFLLSMLPALLLAVAIGPGRPLAADEVPPEERVLGALPLDDLSPRERERVGEAVRKLLRLHRAAGDPGAGEVEAYVEAVEDLARYLKRETVEESRRLLEEAAAAFQLVDREWIDRAFVLSGQENYPVTDQNLAKLRAQSDALRRVGDLIKEEQAILGRQKGLTAGAERRYRDLLRLNQEAHRTLESIDREPIRAALGYVVDDMDRTLQETVRPAHDRQIRLLALFRNVAASVGRGPADPLLTTFREYASKLRVLERRIEGATADTAVSD